MLPDPGLRRQRRVPKGGLLFGFECPGWSGRRPRGQLNQGAADTNSSVIAIRLSSGQTSNPECRTAIVSWIPLNALAPLPEQSSGSEDRRLGPAQKRTDLSRGHPDLLLDAPGDEIKRHQIVVRVEGGDGPVDQRLRERREVRASVGGQLHRWLESYQSEQPAEQIHAGSVPRGCATLSVAPAGVALTSPS